MTAETRPLGAATRALGAAVSGRAAFVAAYVLTNLLNYAFLVAMGQTLDAHEFSLFAALFGAVYFASALQNTAQTALAAAVAARPHAVASTVRRIAAVLALAAIPGTPLLLLAAWPIGTFLHSSSVIPVVMAGAAIWISMLAAVGYGALQGHERFGLLGLSLLAAAAGRIVVGLGLVFAGFAATGGLAGIAIGIAASAIIALAPFRRTEPSSAGPAQIADGPERDWHIGDALLPALVVSCVIAGHTSLDLILVRHLFAAEDAATYAAVTVVAKAVVFCSMAIALLQFPSIVAAQSAGVRPPVVRPLCATIAVAAAVGLAACAAFVAVPEVLFRGYDVGAPFFAVYLAATICFAASVTLLYHLLATRRFRVLALAPVLMLVQTAIIAAWHPNLESVAVVVLATTSFLTLALAAASLWPRAASGPMSFSPAASSLLRERRAA